VRIALQMINPSPLPTQSEPTSTSREKVKLSLIRSVEWRRGRVVRVTAIFVVFVCLALIGMNTWLIVRARSAEIEQITQANSNLAKAVSQHVQGTVAIAEHIVSGIVFELERADMTPQGIERMQPVLVDHVARMQSIKGLFVFDAQGRWLVHSEAFSDTRRRNADRAYFAHHRDNPSTRTLISGPIVSRSSGEWVIPVSRRMNDADGNFAGVVLATLSVRQLNAVLDQFRIGAQGTIELFNGDQLLVRRPFREADMGRRDLEPALQKLFQTQRSGTTEGTSPLDGVDRIISFEHMSDHPVLVAVGVGRDEALQNWRTTSIYQSLSVVLLCIVVSASGTYLVGSMRRRLKAERRLRSTRDELTQVNDRLAHLADSDGLTGLANRRHFDARLFRAFEQAQALRHALAVVMIDVDDFKKYNDLYGHLQGDECLQRVAHALRASVDRPGCVVARYGGEEMVLLLPKTALAEATSIAESARQAVFDLQIPHAATPLGSVSISLGLAAWLPLPDSVPADLMRAADAALYRAKLKGKNVLETDGALGTQAMTAQRTHEPNA